MSIFCIWTICNKAAGGAENSYHLFGMAADTWVEALVRLNARTGLDTAVYSDEYSKVSAEIELFRERRQKLKEQSAQDCLRIERIKGTKSVFDG